MNRGCGIVYIHYATGLGAGDVKDDGEHHQPVARIFEATINPGKKVK